MSTEFMAAKVNPSYAVAVTIANACPDAFFCGFKVKPKADGTFTKMPISKAGAGVGADIDHAKLVNNNELRQLIDPPNNSDYWGIFMQNRMTYDPFGELVLTILDLDTKRSTAPRDIRMVKLMDLAKERGLLTERSHSKKGGHIIFLAKPDETLPPQINLGNHQEIEIFGHPKSAGKNVMFTGDSLKGQLIELGCTVKEFFESAGIQVTPPTPEVKKPSEGFDFTPLLSRHPASDYDKAMDALQYINPDADYDTWLAMGLALQKEFGDRAKHEWMSWSMNRAKPTTAADLEKHWKSFGKKDGIGIGTLFHTAKQAGWKQPTKSSERRSAVDDFQNLLKPEPVSTGSQDEPPAPKATRWQAVPLNLDNLEPIDYLIDGFFAHSFSVIAGQPGVGKTTAMLAVALIAAGFTIGDSGLKAEARRKIIYVSEDTAQVRRSLYAYAKHMNINRQELAQHFVLVESIRSTAEQALELAHLVIEHTVADERPWLIIDTANATLDIENENDNSQVGAYIAALKQTIYTQLNTSITIITHTAKTMANTDDSAMARGASAYTGDATLTAVLFMDEEKNRYLRLVKTRYEPAFREIMLVSHIHTEAVVNRHGSLQEVKCVIVTPQSSSEADRKQLMASKSDAKQKQKIQDKSDEVCAFIQSVINRHPEGVIIRKGSHVPKKPPEDMQECYQLQWDDVYQHVPGADKGEMRRAVGVAIFARFAPDAGDNCWVQLG
jgi:KaiC/GvpD/RAD55 family RecA-like ATPase